MAEEGVPISYVPAQEMRCILHWFAQWTDGQRSHFLQDLLCKAVPGQLCLLLEGLGSLNLSAPGPNLFQCQMRLWDQWFQSWDEDERNEFLRRLGQQDPDFVALFHKQITMQERSTLYQSGSLTDLQEMKIGCFLLPLLHSAEPSKVQVSTLMRHRLPQQPQSSTRLDDFSSIDQSLMRHRLPQQPQSARCFDDFSCIDQSLLRIGLPQQPQSATRLDDFSSIDQSLMRHWSPQEPQSTARL